MNSIAFTEGYGAAGKPAAASLKILDESARKEFVAPGVEVEVAPEIQRSDEIGILRLVLKKVRKMIEEFSAFAGAPVAPEARLPRIFVVIEDLLRPGIADGSK